MRTRFGTLQREKKKKTLLHYEHYRKNNISHYIY